VQDAYRSGAATATQVVEACLERVEAYDQAGPQLNVAIALNPQALSDGRARRAGG